MGWRNRFHDCIVLRMRRSASLLILLLYYGLWAGLIVFLAGRYPVLSAFLPIGGVDDLSGANIDSFESVYTSVERNLLTGAAAIF